MGCDLKDAARSAVQSALEEAIELVEQAEKALRSAGVPCSSLRAARGDLGLKLDAARAPRRYYLGKYLIGVYDRAGERLVGTFDNPEQLAVWMDCSARAARVAVSAGSSGDYRFVKVPI